MANIPVNASDAFVIVDVTTNGQTSYDFNFLAMEIDQLRAFYTSPAGVIVDFLPTENFTATGLEQPNGGTITLLWFSAVIGGTVTIYRESLISRPADYQTDLFADTINREMDHIYMILQEHQRDLDRATKVGIGEDEQDFPDPDSGKFIGWSSTGILSNLQVASTGNVVFGNFGETLVNTDTRAEAISVLDGGAFGDNLFRADTRTEALALLDIAGNNFDNAARLQFWRERMRDGVAVKIVCFGDSITEGNGATSGGTAYPGALENMLQEFYNNPLIDLINEGVGGETTQDLIDRYAASITAHDPDIVLLMIGTNDANPAANVSTQTFAANYSTLLQTMINDGIAVLVGDITPRKRINNDGPDIVDAYRKVVHAVTAAYGVQCILFHQILTDLVSSKNGYSWIDLSTDGIHYRDLGYRQIAGAWLAYGLSLEPLNMKCGKHKDMIGSHVRLVGNAIATYTMIETNPNNSKEAATLRYTATDGSSNLKIWVWVEDYEFSDCVLYLTRERHETLLPKVTVANTEIATEAAKAYTLGEINASPGRAISVPLRACGLRPGLNVISTRVAATDTCEFAKFAAVPVAEDLPVLTGFPGERYVDAAARYSSAAGNLNWAAEGSFITPENRIVAVPASSRMLIGVVDPWRNSPSGWLARYRLRGKIVNGLIIELGDRSFPGAEHTPVISMEFALTSGTVWTVTTTLNLGFSPQVLSTIAVTVTDTTKDVLITFSLLATATLVYLDGNSSPAATIPYALGPAPVVIKNGGAGTAIFNSIFRTATNGFTDLVDGEEWVDFSNSQKKLVISGTAKTLTYA